MIYHEIFGIFTKLLVVICWCIIFVFQYVESCNAVVDGKIVPVQKKSIKILSIGNSFSLDAHYYLYNILQSMGYDDITVANIYLSGCTLARHRANLEGNKSVYQLQIYDSSNNGKYQVVFNVRISGALSLLNWDFITLQQASGNSGQAETYSDAAKLAKYVRTHAPQAKLIWHMTWAYQSDSTHGQFAKYGRNQMQMYEAITSAVQGTILPGDDFAAVIPVGTAIQNARFSSLGDTLTRDGYHLGYTTGRGVPGRYIASLAFARELVGEIPTDVFVPDNVNREQQRIAINAVNAAHASPFTVDRCLTPKPFYTLHFAKAVRARCSPGFGVLGRGERRAPYYFGNLIRAPCMGRTAPTTNS